MSYDIEVYGKLRLAPSEVQTGTSSVTASEIAGEGLVQAFTHDSGEYCFIVDGPHDVGGEDMDSVPTGLPDNVRFRYRVVVEGSAQPHIGHALRFADELAGVVGGVVHDPQVVVEETSDPRYVSRRTGPSREKFLHVEWFRRFDEESPSFAQMYLESAKEHLPAALPTVFGVSEPLRGKLAAEGAEGVDRIYREDGDRSRLVLRGRKPLISGFVSGWSDQSIAEQQRVRLVFDAAALSKPRFVSAFESFFIELARRSSSFFSYAEVTQSRFSPTMALPQWGEWPGLPQSPPWLSWFSTEYADLVRPHLTAGAHRELSGGMVYRSNMPATSVSASWTEPGAWVPSEFVPVQADPDNHRKSTARASEMPVALLSSDYFVKVR